MSSRLDECKGRYSAWKGEAAAALLAHATGEMFIAPVVTSILGERSDVVLHLIPTYIGAPLILSLVTIALGVVLYLSLDRLRGAMAGVLAAIVAGIRLVRRLRPAIVVGLGGYASVPCVIGAVLWRVPIVVAEQNAVPGAANRLAGRFAKACAVSFDGVSDWQIGCPGWQILAPRR